MDQVAAVGRLLIPTVPTSARDDRRRPTSAILRDVARDARARVRLDELSDRLGERGFGLMLLVFALPNAIPLPIPGVSTLTSLPLIYVAAQLAFGQPRVALPSWLARREIALTAQRPWIRRSLPWLRRVERLARPRLVVVSAPWFDRCAGGVILFLACLIALPVPFSNLPLGLAMSALALAIVERDGVLMIVGWMLAIVAAGVFAALAGGYSWLIWSATSTVF
jgi:hypothetical protein